MRLRIRFGELRFVVDIKEENPTLLILKEAVCKAASVRDVSAIKISLNGKDTIDGDEMSLHSYGLVNGDLLYVHSSTVLPMDTDYHHDATENGALFSELVQVRFDQNVSDRSLVQTSNTSVEAASETITSNQLKGPESSKNVTPGVASKEISPETPGVSQLLSEDLTASYGRRGYEATTAIDIPNPAFCRDGVSVSLASMFITAGVKTQHEAMFVIIHAVMLESGFQSTTKKRNEHYENQHQTEVMPDGWNEGGASRLKYVHSLSPSVVCDVVATSLGPFVYAHAWSSQTNCSCHQVKLLVSQFVRGDVSLSAGARLVYRNLHKVSRLVKDSLVHPLLASLRHYLGITSPFSLIGLPDEMKLMIYSQLDVRSTVRLSCTCKGLSHTGNDQKLWSFFCQRDFGVKEKTFACWKKQYKVLYEQKHTRKNRLASGLPILPGPYPETPIFNPFLPRLPPDFIGGSTDLFPDFMNIQPRDRSLPHPSGNSRFHVQLMASKSSTRQTYPH